MVGICWNCGRENSGDTCYSCGFEVVYPESDEQDCDCDPAACSHGNYVKCEHCGESIRINDECSCKGARVEHAKKHGRAIDVWEAENVE